MLEDFVQSLNMDYLESLMNRNEVIVKLPVLACRGPELVMRYYCQLLRLQQGWR